jgi:hypothetical protein
LRVRRSANSGVHSTAFSCTFTAITSHSLLASPDIFVESRTGYQRDSKYLARKITDAERIGQHIHHVKRKSVMFFGKNVGCVCFFSAFSLLLDSKYISYPDKKNEVVRNEMPIRANFSSVGSDENSGLQSDCPAVPRIGPELRDIRLWGIMQIRRSPYAPASVHKNKDYGQTNFTIYNWSKISFHARFVRLLYA